MEEGSGEAVLNGYKYEWMEEVMDLSAYAGETIQVRFRFTSDNSTQFVGFYIDDIIVLSYLHEPLLAPQLLFPASLSDVPRRTTFLWHSSRFAAAYHIQIAYDNLFLSLEGDTVVADTALKLSSSLWASAIALLACQCD